MNLRLTIAGACAAISAALSPASVAWAAACITPPAGCVVSSHFGERIHPVTKVRKAHRGTDFACPIGTPLKAVEDGVILRAIFDPGGGNVVVLTGTSGRQYKYLHMSRFDPVSANMKPVRQGQLVGYSGNTGAWTTGPHLHFEAWTSGSTPVNPLGVICGGAPSNGPDILGGEDPTGDPVALVGEPAAPLGLDGGLHALFMNIVATRALNPDYPAQLATLSKERLYAEIAYMESASLRLRVEMAEARERMEVMYALRHSLATEQKVAPALNAARTNATTR